MEREKIHFYIIVGVIFIITGIVSIVYSAIIPVRNYQYNAFAELIFLISGIVLIIGGIFLILMRKRLLLSQKNSVKTGGGQIGQ